MTEETNNKEKRTIKDGFEHVDNDTKRPQIQIKKSGDNINLKKDIEKILDDIKLPEMRDVKVKDFTKKNSKITDSKKVQQQSPGQTNKKAQTDKNENADNWTKKISIHTLAGDLQNVVRTKKISLVRSAVLEQKKQREKKQESDPTSSFVKRNRSRKFLFILMLVLVLIALGVGALFVVLQIQSQRSTKPNNVELAQSKSLLFTEQTFVLPIHGLSRQSIMRQLSKVRDESTFTLGAITRIIPTTKYRDINTGLKTERPVTTSEFFSFILNTKNMNELDSLFRALSDTLFIGVHVVDKNVPVIVVPVLSYERAFAGMLSWEQNINTDLSPFFVFVKQKDPATKAFATPSDFEDVIIKNYDVRVLKDSNGKIKMLYSFPNRNILIIAESPHTFVEILSRLRSAHRI